MPFLEEIITHPVLSACFLGWLIAQLLKVVDSALRKGEWTLRGMFELGGMPSSHAALVVALAFSILLTEGITSLFAIALVVALVVMRDAMGVRRQVGEHALIINKMNHYAKLPVRQGHTPLQVWVGACIGLIAAIFVVRSGVTMYFLLQVFYLILPAVAANGMPIIAKRLHPNWNAPVDGGKKWGGKPLLGENKTWRGLTFGMVAAIVVVLVQGWLHNFEPFTSLSLYSYSKNLLIVGLLIGMGVLGGDLIKSFVKRRMRIPPGRPFPPWDQLDAIIGGLIVLIGFHIYVPSGKVILVIFFVGLSLHFLLNGLKSDLGWA